MSRKEQLLQKSLDWLAKAKKKKETTPKKPKTKKISGMPAISFGDYMRHNFGPGKEQQSNKAKLRSIMKKKRS